jgi:hypothetical protein
MYFISDQLHDENYTRPTNNRWTDKMDMMPIYKLLYNICMCTVDSFNMTTGILFNIKLIQSISNRMYVLRMYVRTLYTFYCFVG